MYWPSVCLLYEPYCTDVRDKMQLSCIFSWLWFVLYCLDVAGAAHIHAVDELVAADSFSLKSKQRTISITGSDDSGQAMFQGSRPGEVQGDLNV